MIATFLITLITLLIALFVQARKAAREARRCQHPPAPVPVLGPSRRLLRF